MTTPSLMKSFDTSLVEVQRSFSSTETMTSGSGSSAKENLPPPVESSRPFKDVTNAELYEQWAPTYDTDGNVLQAIDDMKTKSSIPQLVEDLRSSTPDTKGPATLNIVDFGCGTGRSTLKLLNCPWNRPVVINAWDISLEMLNIAKAKCGHMLSSSQPRDHSHMSTDFRLVEFGSLQQLPTSHVELVDGLVSTLVLEHIPLDVYWNCISALLKPGGMGLMSNMHPDMGAGSVAGFKDESGQRLIGRSYVHGVQETAEGAMKAGLEVWDVEEEAVEEAMIESGVVGERGRKRIGKKIWYGMRFRKPMR